MTRQAWSGPNLTMCEWCKGAPAAVGRFCGKACVARYNASNRVSFAGAANPNYRGGKRSHPLYHTYHDMVALCTRSTHARYADYGGRGITVCDRWRQDFWAFAEDMGDRPEGLSLDRIDNDGPYSPDNCQWSTRSQQMRNRRPSAWAHIVKIGNGNPTSKLTPADRRQIQINYHLRDWTVKSLAEAYPVSEARIYQVIREDGWP